MVYASAVESKLQEAQSRYAADRPARKPYLKEKSPVTAGSYFLLPGAVTGQTQRRLWLRLTNSARPSSVMVFGPRL